MGDLSVEVVPVNEPDQKQALDIRMRDKSEKRLGRTCPAL